MSEQERPADRSAGRLHWHAYFVAGMKGAPTSVSAVSPRSMLPPCRPETATSASSDEATSRLVLCRLPESVAAPLEDASATVSESTPARTEAPPVRTDAPPTAPTAADTAPWRPFAAA